VVSTFIGTDSFSLGDNLFYLVDNDTSSCSAIVSRLRKELNLPIPFEMIVANPTITSLAIAIEANQSTLNELAGQSPPFSSTKSYMRRDFHTTHQNKPPGAIRSSLGRYFLQLAGLFFIFTIYLLNMTPPLALFAFIYLRYSIIFALFTLPGVYISWAFMSTITTFACKWLIIGRYRSGTYPVWGLYHFRWWIVDRLVSNHRLFLSPLRESPLLAFFLRLLGCNIDRRVQLATHLLSEYDLVTVEEGARLNVGTRISPAMVENGSLILRRITIGKYADISPYCYISAGVKIQPYCTLAPLSTVPYNMQVSPSHSHFSGSTLERVSGGRKDGNTYSPPVSIMKTLSQSLILFMAAILSGLSMAPSAYLAHLIYTAYGLLLTAMLFPALWLLASTLYAVAAVVTRRVAATRIDVQAETVLPADASKAWFVATILAQPALKPFLDHFSGSVVIVSALIFFLKYRS
jgi:non-ribosomal peptide synthetase-like protein